jgi:hypothetical protein
MIIISKDFSDIKKFIFFHLPKAAGSSISHPLKKYNLNYNLPPHTTPFKLIEKLGKDFYNSYYKFAFVRNPWDWQVSTYFFILNYKSHQHHNIVKKLKFNDYINWVTRTDYYTQYQFLSEGFDSDSKITLDFIGKFETLENDFKKICKEINLDIELPHMNKTNHSNYKTYYNIKTWNLVKDTYKKDIDYFGYETDY